MAAQEHSVWWGPRKCPFCTKSFEYLTGLLSHCESEHDEVETIKPINQQGETMDINKAWYDEEETSPIEVPEFETLLNEMYTHNKMIKRIKSELKDEQEILTKMKFKVLAYFEEFGKTKHLAQHCTVYIKTSFTCKTPKTPEEKAALFTWMKEKEIYDQYATVNSKSLNTLYNSLVKEDSDFVMPGTSDPGYFQTIEMRST